MSALIKSRERVQKFGEVFTPPWMVNEMLDVPEITAALRDPTTKFLEPCCGEGAFLTEILRRKINFNPNSNFDALRNIFGIEIQADNLVYARKNLAEIFANFYQLDFHDARIWDILNRNVILGDALKILRPPAVQTNLFDNYGVDTMSDDSPYYKVLSEQFGLTADEIKNMVIISNPPYQEDKRGDTSNYARPVYHKFVEAFHKTSNRAMVIHPARCLFNAGATPKDFNDKILNDEHVTVPIYEPNAKKVFPNIGVDIKGGVAVTYRDANKNYGKIDTFTPFEELNSILHKVIDRKDFRPLNEIMYSQTTYRLTPKFHKDNPNAVNIISKGHANDFSTIIMNRFRDLFFDDKPTDGSEYIQIHGRQDDKRVCKWFRSDWVTHPKPFYKFKVLIPKAYGGTGALNENGPTMLVGSPLVGSTESFVTLGAFDSAAEAEAAMKFVKSKFARALLGVRKVTQEATPDKWDKVPMQNFTGESDINWGASVAEIDEQLYAKYGLDAREVAFIEAKVKAMT